MGRLCIYVALNRHLRCVVVYFLKRYFFETCSTHRWHLSSFQIRKYIIQAQVLRDSWPLSKNSWDFVAMLKSLDRLEVDGTVMQILSIISGCFSVARVLLIWFLFSNLAFAFAQIQGHFKTMPVRAKFKLSLLLSILPLSPYLRVQFRRKMLLARTNFLQAYQKARKVKRATEVKDNLDPDLLHRWFSLLLLSGGMQCA